MAFYLGGGSFVGRYQVATPYNSSEDVIYSYIRLYEKNFVSRLFGKELADMFYIDYLAPRFEDIRLPFSFIHDEKTYTSTGLEDVLTALIYCHYIREQLEFNTSIGTMKPSVEAGSVANDNYTSVFKLYNSAVKSSLVIQLYLKVKPATYPEFANYEELKTTYFI